ncbi:DUF5700 domain-containing putative Zn-dependent protease [Pedobacter caeni]|uniref:Uncharacterized protein n=1 Tax=Pedobacter caeni TaxID=288992 RepID=A0A1M4ZXT7_9SPHI|nr:DUF5700 domain-containing putative Zn-dependent protease [Pedobacter caeni]SHF22860.1 hypothetical protein SAMN04488522_102509 [Pedobacter caeni]
MFINKSGILCLNRFSIVTLIVFLVTLGTPKITFAQTAVPLKNVDTAPIDLYLEIAEHIKKNGTLDEALVKKYFSHPIVSLFKHRPGFDSVKFLNNLKAVYSNKPIPTSQEDDDYLLMKKYFQNEVGIRKGLELVKQTNIGEMVRKRLKPFYPESINLDSIQLHFVYMFLDEGNGGLPGYVLNSALQTSYLDKKHIDIISAHEAYHTITNAVFTDRFKLLLGATPSDKITSDQNLLWYIQIVSEEGIADLIDKKIISSGKSPLVGEVNRLRENETVRAEKRIQQLDSLLADTNGNLNFLSLNDILENGGHIPGRFMAEKIEKANLLGKFIQHTGNPFQFLYLYNEAVKGQISLPRFSERSISNLKALEYKIQHL